MDLAVASGRDRAEHAGAILFEPAREAAVRLVLAEVDRLARERDRAFEPFEPRDLRAPGGDRLVERGDVGDVLLADAQLALERMHAQVRIVRARFELGSLAFDRTQHRGFVLRRGFDAGGDERVELRLQREFVLAAQDVAAAHREHREAVVEAVPFAPPRRAPARGVPTLVAAPLDALDEGRGDRVEPRRLGGRARARGPRAVERLLPRRGARAQRDELVASAHQLVEGDDAERIEHGSDGAGGVAFFGQRGVGDLLFRTGRTPARGAGARPRDGGEAEHESDRADERGPDPQMRDRDTEAAQYEGERRREQSAREHASVVALASGGGGIVAGRGRSRVGRLGLRGGGAQGLERVLVERSGVARSRGELFEFARAGRVACDVAVRRIRHAVRRAPGMEGVLEFGDAVDRELRHVVERRPRGLQRGQLVAVVLQRRDARAELRGAQRACPPFQLGRCGGRAIAFTTRGADAFAQLRESGEHGPRVLGGAAHALVLFAQCAQRRVLVRALRADVFAQRRVETFDRADRGVFFRPAVERLRERGRHGVRRRTVETDRALARARGLQKDLERNAQVRFTRNQRPAAADAGRRVVAVVVVDADALRVAVVGAVDFPTRAVGGFVAQHGAVRVRGPRPPAVLLSALQTVQRCDDRCGERRFPRLVRSDDDVESRCEVEHTVGEPAEPFDAQRTQFHGVGSAPSKAATA